MITFTVPTYNEERYIAKCVKSLFAQSGRVEVIVADSHSTDRTAKIAEDLGAKVLFDPRGNTGRSRDKAMRAGKGEILVSCSADAYYPQGWLEKITAPIYARKADAVIGSIYIDGENLIEKAGGHLINEFIFPITSLMNIVYANADNLALDREFYHRIGGFPHVMTGEDTMLVRNAKKYGRVLYNKDAAALTSPRRMRNWGYFKYALFHTRNFIEANILNRTHGKYEPIR
jgi:glycosyltransferase involved in cell wall biosynthesis